MSKQFVGLFWVSKSKWFGLFWHQFLSLYTILFQYISLDLLSSLAVGASLLPIAAKPVYAWMTGLWALSMAKLNLNIITGLAATAIIILLLKKSIYRFSSILTTNFTTIYSSSSEIEDKIFKISAELMSSRSLFEQIVNRSTLVGDST